MTGPAYLYLTGQTLMEQIIGMPRRNHKRGSKPAGWSSPNGRTRTRARAAQMAQASQDFGARWWIHNTRAGVTATDRVDPTVMLKAGDGQAIGDVVAPYERSRSPHCGARS